MPLRTISVIAIFIITSILWGFVPLTFGATNSFDPDGNWAWASSFVAVAFAIIGGYLKIKLSPNQQQTKPSSHEFCGGFNKVNIRMGKLESRVVRTETENTSVAAEIKEMRVDIRWIRDNLFKVNE